MYNLLIVIEIGHHYEESYFKIDPPLITLKLKAGHQPRVCEPAST